MADQGDPRAFIAKLAESKLATMSDDLRRALKLLGEQLYGRDVHFVMELIQNAEDNTYAPDASDRFIRFTVGPDTIEVHNNEVGFSRRNVEALCAVGDSTKRERTLGYVGEKGIGFKSVFQVCAEPAIFSSGICFGFDDHNYIVPHWHDPPPHVDPHHGTTIVLKLRHDYRKGGGRPIGAQVADLDPRLMLFLKKLTRIVVSDRTANSEVEYRRVDVGHGCVRVEGGGAESTWRLFARTVEVPEHIQEEKRHDVHQRELIVAFRVDEEGRCIPDRESPVFAFLPTEQRPGFSFLLQGDFLLTADRGAILEGNRWNLWLRDEVGPTIVAAISNGVPRPEFALGVLNCVPLAWDIGNPFFRGIAEHVVENLPKKAVFITAGGKLRPAAEVLRASHALRSLFPNEELTKLLGRPVEYLHAECDSSTSGAILDALGVRRFDREALLQILENKRWLGQRTEQWFTALYGFLHEHEHLVPAETLRGLHLVLLENKELARPTDGTIYLPVREERLEERYGLSQFRWRLVAHAVVRRDPSPTTEEARVQNERTQKAREFLVDRLGVQYHRPLEIAVEQIFPYLEKRLAKPYGREELRRDFGLVLYLKEQWSDICEWSERPAAAVGPSALIERASRCIPVPVSSTGNKGVGRVGETYMPAGFGGSAALDRLLFRIPNVEFLSDVIVSWDQQRARDERKIEEWTRFLSAVGANQRLRLVRGQTTGRRLESPGEPVPDGARVTRIERELDAPELDALLEKMTNVSPESRRERAQQLLRRLDDWWGDWERQHGGSAEWYFATYHYKPIGKGNYQEQTAKVPALFVRKLRRAAWVPTQDGRCLRPEEVWVDSGKVRESAARVGALLQGQITHSGLIRALGLRTEVSADAIIGDLRRLVADGRADLGPFVSRYKQLAKLECDGNLTDHDREILNRERLIYVPDRTPPFANALEVVWYEPAGLVARGFPALERHYDKTLLDFFTSIGVSERITPTQALQTIAGVSEDVSSDQAARLRLWEAYQVLAGADLVADADEEGVLATELARFRGNGRLFCRYNRFRPIDRVYAPDDERVVALFGRQIDFLWLPDGAPISVVRRLAEVLHLACASEATKTVEATEAEAPADFVDGFNACRRPLAGYLRQEHQGRFQSLFKDGKLGEFAAAPLIPASSLTVRYTLGDLEVADSRYVHAMIDGRGIYVLVADAINLDEVAVAIQRDLGNVAAVAEVFTVLFERRNRDREAYARKRHYEIPDEDWQRILESYQPMEPEYTESEVGDVPAPHSVGGTAPNESPEPSVGSLEDGVNGHPQGVPSEVQQDQTSPAPSIPPSMSRGVPFRGRTQLPSPKGSNERLRARLGSSFPARRTDIEDYFQEAVTSGVTTLEAHPDEDGVVRRARTVLRAANLEEGFLQFDPSAMAMFRAAGDPDEILLMSDDDEDPVLAKIDYERSILHAGQSSDDKLRFRAFLERDALPPGAYLELEATHQADEYHLHGVRLDEPHELSDVSWWDFDDDGAPKTMSASSVRLPFLVHEATYRAERRWEQRQAYHALVSGNPGILADVHAFLEERRKTDATGAMATEIHRHLLSHDHPCAYASVLGVLYGYECFTHDPDGRWRLIVDAEKARRAGYEKNLVTADEPSGPHEAADAEKPQAGPERREHSGAKPRTEVAELPPRVEANDHHKEADSVNGAFSSSQIVEIDRALAILSRPDRNGDWLQAVRTVADIFNRLLRSLEPSRTDGRFAAERARAAAKERLANLLALARRSEGDPQRGLAAALLAWQATNDCGDRRQADALRLVGLAMQGLGAPRWALSCLTEAGRSVLVPKLAPLREAARNAAVDEWPRILSAAKAAARVLSESAGMPLPELDEEDWPARVLARLPKVQ